MFVQMKTKVQLITSGWQCIGEYVGEDLIPPDTEEDAYVVKAMFPLLGTKIYVIPNDIKSGWYRYVIDRYTWEISPGMLVKIPRFKRNLPDWF